MGKGKWMVAALVMAMGGMVAGEAQAQNECPESQAEFQFGNRTVPSTVPGALYRNCSSHSPEGTPNLEVFEADSGDAVEIAVEAGRDGLFEIIFVDELEPETDYTVQADPQCLEVGSQEMRQWTFSTSEALDFPEEVGRWGHTPIFTDTVTYDGPNSCTEQGAARFVEWKFQPSDEAAPWRSALAYETFVDGELWEPPYGEGRTVPAGRSRVARGDDRIYVVCEEDRPVSKPYAKTLEGGLYNIRIDAWLPGTELRWEGNSTSLYIDCDEEEEPNPQNPDENGNGENNGNGEIHGDGNGDDDGGCAAVGGSAGLTAVALMVIGLIGVRRRSKGLLD